ncbi:MAG: hypothetical protein J6B85_09240 [Lachnospiraceae bacterium]|nr:hypothetical protein [Lachnospiraceae bacterium]
MTNSDYPKCRLCEETLGYAGRRNHPARQTLRIVPAMPDGEEGYLQYSPYVYYNEHCIVFCGEHRSMKIDKGAFRRLFDFVERFPYYFVGSNAESILFFIWGCCTMQQSTRYCFYFRNMQSIFCV